ncbi:MAG: GNAT family N-acetyltransferase [Verrucomicrobiales bacterium]|nr:GNAT family N-acetyltransferase [Verrucomicrobiales bacterium]
MNRLSYEEFLAHGDEFDRAVSRTPEIARFCSSALWQKAAHDTMQQPEEGDEYFIFEEEGNWIVFAERGGRRIFYPLEAAWMFGSPLIGDPLDCLDLLRRATTECLDSPFGFCFGGIRKGGILHRAIMARREECLQFEEFPATDCVGIDLSGGYDEWLARRSKKFRKSIRQLRLPEGVSIEDVSRESPGELFSRIEAVQRETYKWAEGIDIFQVETYRKFYRILLEELHDREDLRILFARREDSDLAYIFGGVQNTTYRGFQMSYIEEAKPLGIGNALQLRNLQLRADEGILHYDLGMHSPYKERWADRWDEYVGAFLVW